MDATHAPRLGRAPLVAVGAVVSLELSVAVSSGLLWIGLLGIGPTLIVSGLVVRLIVTLVWFGYRMRPIFAFAGLVDRGQPLSDRALTETDAALQSLSTRAGRASALTWTVAIGFVLVVAAATHALPHAELLAATLLAAVLVSTAPVLLFHPLRHTLGPVQHELGRALLERGLTPEREQYSMARELAVQNAITIMALIGTGCAVGVLLRVETSRTEARVSLERDVERQAAGRGDGEAMIVEPAELPAVLTDESERGDLRSAFDPSTGRVVAAAALDDGRWLLAEAEPDEQLGFLAAFVVAFFISSLLPSIYNSKLLGRSVVDPLAELDHTTRELVEVGQLPEVARLIPLRNDEIGALAQTFNTMLDAFDELAAAAAAVADGDLRVRVERPGNLPEAYRAMLETLRTVVASLRETTEGLTGAVDELGSVVAVQTEAASIQTARTSEVMTTTAALANSATQISRASAAVRSNAEQSVAMTSATATQIAELESAARGIRELLELIDEVADRSDLLALNGSLEAVRAGEAGRGFGLVAAEMRRLAERVNGAVADISERVTGIEVAVDATVAATERSRELATSTASAAREIDEALTRHERQSGQTLALVEEVAGTGAAFELAGSQIHATATGLEDHANELRRILDRFKLE